MTRVIRGTGRALVLAGLATAAAVALSACSAGQVTQTSDQVAAVPGFSFTAPAPNGGNVGVRNITAAYNGPKGYAKGANAPLELWIFNETTSPVDVEISSSSAASVTLVSGPASGATESPAASASPSASASASAKPNASASVSPTPAETKAPTAGKPAKVTIPAAGYVVLSQSSGTFARLNGLTQDLPPGSSVHLTFKFSNGVTFDAEAPMGIPLSPLPRSPIEGAGHE